MKLSILICTIEERSDQLKTLLKFLKVGKEKTINGGYYKIKVYDCGEYEVITCCDNAHMKVGTKRNKLMDAAKGKYLTYVDDDDTLDKDYIKEILAATDKDVDVITYKAVMYSSGVKKYDVIYDPRLNKDYEDETTAYRRPNHLMVWNRRKIMGIRFPPQSFGEDYIFARNVSRRIRSFHEIDKVLYSYMFDPTKTRTQQNIR
jgi:cellulose synthase/poly-beta-1,6-N-acetylglucosamine synthase-like glycosyltransferase